MHPIIGTRQNISNNNNNYYYGAWGIKAVEAFSQLASQLATLT